MGWSDVAYILILILAPQEVVEFSMVMTRVVCEGGGRGQGGQGGSYRAFRDNMEEKKDMVSLDDSRRDKNSENHFGKTRIPCLFSQLSSVFTVPVSCPHFSISQCAGDHCIDKSPLVAPWKLACSPCSLLLLLGTRISKLILVCTDGACLLDNVHRFMKAFAARWRSSDRRMCASMCGKGVAMKSPWNSLHVQSLNEDGGSLYVAHGADG